MGQIRRAPRTSNFTVLHNATIDDERLSWEALGMLTYLLSKPDDWQIKTEHLIALRKAKDHKTRRILNELEDTGYLVRTKYRRDDGTFGWESVLYDTPQESPNAANLATTGFSSTGSASTGSASTGKPPPIVNTEGTKTELTKTEEVGEQDDARARARAREEAPPLPFLVGEYREAYLRPMQYALDDYPNAKHADVAVRRLFGKRAGYSHLKWVASVLDQGHAWPMVLAALLVTADQADSPNVQYAAKVLSSLRSGRTKKTQAGGTSDVVDYDALVKRSHA